MTESPEEKAKGRVRQLIWLFLWVLLTEGVLRKWGIPRFSDPLLLIRDPVMLGIYFYAIKAHVFPRNVWAVSLWIIGILSAVAILGSPLFPYLQLKAMVEVTAYGFRSNF